jgi:tRNA (mo5U34)-methyltransferase
MRDFGSPEDVQRLGPWMYEFELPDGVKTPLLNESLRQIHAVRRSMIFEFLEATRFDPAATVLDLACNEGFFALEFAKRGAARVVGIDVRARTIEKAEYVCRRFGLTTCRFEVGDVTERDLAPYTADVVLLLGIIYHVEDPIRLIRRAALATSRVLFLETQLTKPHAPLAHTWGSPEIHEAKAAWAMVRERPETDELSAIRGFSLIPNAAAVVAVLREIGFRSIVQLHPNDRVNEPQYENVDRAVFAALR